MNNFSFFELIAFFHRSIFDQVRQGISLDQSIGISVDSFWDHSPTPSDLQNIIVLIESINVEYSITHKFRFQAIELYKDLLPKVNEIDLSSFLKDYEIEVLKESFEVLDNELLNYQFEQ